MKLIAQDESVYMTDGHYMFSISMSPRQKEILDCVDKADDESWLNYKTRTKQEMRIEDAKRHTLAKFFVDAYNRQNNMKVNVTVKIEVPSAGTVEMTAEELLKFHDDLTKFINDNWEALKDNSD